MRLGRRGAKGRTAKPNATESLFQDGSRVIASPGSILVRIGQPDTSIAIHAPDGALLWSGRIEKVE
jgi:hypothetical protein